MASSTGRADRANEAHASQSPAMGGLCGAETLPAPGAEVVQASASTSAAFCAGEGHRSCTVAEQIQRSQSHWSDLSVPTSTRSSEKPGFTFFRSLSALIRGGERRFVEDRAVRIDNRKVFMQLQSHPSWGGFFCTFGYTLPVPGMFGFIRRSVGLLSVGEKFAEGAQAELFHAHITWNERYERLNQMAQVDGVEWALKVFKKGTLLRHLRSQWPRQYLQFTAEQGEMASSPTYKGVPAQFFSNLLCGTLLREGRFAFVMRREIEDLRSFIDRNMISRTNPDCGPFPKDQTEEIMWVVAKGAAWFHSRNIVHRDLKASNVLVGKAIAKNSLYYCISDYECSTGVVGTKFFRAPEILQACKDRTIGRKPKLFTKAVDVYSYAMTCYEILTGRLPFEGHPQSDYDHVIKGNRPEIPPYVDGWICDLLRRCWDANPTERPSFSEILSIIVANSEAAKALENRHQRLVEEFSLDYGRSTRL